MTIMWIDKTMRVKRNGQILARPFLVSVGPDGHGIVGCLGATGKIRHTMGEIAVSRHAGNDRYVPVTGGYSDLEPKQDAILIDYVETYLGRVYDDLGSWAKVAVHIGLEAADRSAVHKAANRRSIQSKVNKALGLPSRFVTVLPCAKCGQVHTLRGCSSHYEGKRRRRWRVEADLGTKERRELLYNELERGGYESFGQFINGLVDVVQSRRKYAESIKGLATKSAFDELAISIDSLSDSLCEEAKER